MGTPKGKFVWKTCCFISETTSPFPSKVKWPSTSQGKGEAEDGTRNAFWVVPCFFFRSERQPNNIGQAYFYLLGIAIYSYSSFRLGWFEWTNFVSWGRNIVLAKRRWTIVPLARNFSPKRNFRFRLWPRLAKFRRHIKCTEIFAAFQLAFESRRISCVASLSLNTHTDMHTYILHVL